MAHCPCSPLLLKDKWTIGPKGSPTNGIGWQDIGLHATPHLILKLQTFYYDKHHHSQHFDVNLNNRKSPSAHQFSNHFHLYIRMVKVLAHVFRAERPYKHFLEIMSGLQF